ATQGEEILKDMLDTDEGARHLGEVALVGDDSPISQMGLLFRNTLFDENAACHFALGSAYAENHVRGKDMTKEEKREAGINHSITHIDFMVGGPDLQVTGVKADGMLVPLLVDGNWVE
ncbi:MAG: aminopeptidase, partial [Clostridiales bacterium]|nr:aminopeptidase [Clostridiales bacterium]